ncbi:MAG: glycoside hydrolase family 44 protein [Bryobacteraceae bacterium]
MATASLWAQSAPALAVDATASRHPISPLIYGINEWPSYNSSTHVWTDSGMSEAMRVGVRRWGGDNATSYNWQLDIKNNDSDWYFTTYVVGDGVNSTFDLFHEQNLRTGTVSLGTVPVLDWTPKLISGQPLVFNAPMSCSFAVARYGAQIPSNAANCAASPYGGNCAVDPYDTACGSGVSAATGQNIVNDPSDVYEKITPAFAAQWVQSIVSKYGPANLGGVQMWSLDNEPEWWDNVHMDMYHQPATYDDMLKRDIATAQVVKAADPTALITGPVPGGWSGMLFSKADMDSGWSTPPYCYWRNPVDQNAHGGQPWLVYYLQQMQQFEQQNGYRLLDYLDVHGYITPPGVGFDNTTTAANTALRLTSTRAFWDPTYIVPGFTNCSGYSDANGNQVAPALIPTMHGWVNQNYPNTKLAITEYNWGALEDITGAVAQADILGIFGREQIDMATLWPDGSFTLGVPGSYAFQIFLNYDGLGSQFGETSVSATGNPDVLSIFAAQRHDSALTVLVLNKTASAITDSISLKDFTPAATAQVWQYSASNLNAIVRQADLGVSGGSISTTFPAYSMTLFVIPQSQDDMIAPQPVVTAVTSAASYDKSAISPGEIVAIWGQDLGPATDASLQYDSNGLVSTSLGGTQVFINGFPSPLTYAANGQVNAVVPYEVAQAQTANVVVVYQSNASAPFPIAVTAVKPGIFTIGKGQGAILLNSDYSVNSGSNPAPRGEWILIYGTGEGVTTPPGMDGRLSDASGAPLPTVPVTVTCTATIGGQPATVNYCGEAPGFTAGLVQVNAQVPESITPGDAVPVIITIGGVNSQSGVTLAVK